MHKLYALANLNGKLVLEKVTVEEYGITSNDGRRFYNLRGIKIESTDGDPNANASYATMPDVDSNYSVAQLYSFVKTVDRVQKVMSMMSGEIDLDTLSKALIQDYMDRYRNLLNKFDSAKQ